MSKAWSVPRMWAGETVFVIGGGPSVDHADLEQLRGRRVIVINTSYERAPWADLLVFGDEDWWGDNCVDVLARFAGMIVSTTGVQSDRVLELKNSRPDRIRLNPPHPPLALSDDPAAVPIRRTTFAGALNIAYLAGARVIVTLGLDGTRDARGRSHHHRPHRKEVVPGCWDAQGAYDLAPIAADLKARGVTVLNASPGSVHAFFPVMTLPEALAHLEAKVAA